MYRSNLKSDYKSIHKRIMNNLLKLPYDNKTLVNLTRRKRFSFSRRNNKVNGSVLEFTLDCKRILLEDIDGTS